MALSMRRPEPMPDSRARHTRGSTWLSWHRIVTSVGDVIGTWAPGWCRRNRRTVAGKGKSRLGGGGSSDGCDWAVAAYEDASGAKWPALAYEESPPVRPMTGSTKQRSWRHICLLVRG